LAAALIRARGIAPSRRPGRIRTQDVHARARFGRLPRTDVPIYFLEYHRYFDRPHLYGPPPHSYPDNLERFAFLSRGALELVKAVGWIPDVIHAHDWKAALVPVYVDTVEWGQPLHGSDARSHRIQAGADFFVMPSRFEPCGLSQLCAMRYGTLPIVRATGGLVDTVTTNEEAIGDGTGFVFHDLRPDSLADTIGWAVATWYQRPSHIERMRRRAMARDHSWNRSASEYMALYLDAYARRRGHAFAAAPFVTGFTSQLTRLESPESALPAPHPRWSSTLSHRARI